MQTYFRLIWLNQYFSRIILLVCTLRTYIHCVCITEITFEIWVLCNIRNQLFTAFCWHTYESDEALTFLHVRIDIGSSIGPYTIFDRIVCLLGCMSTYKIQYVKLCHATNQTKVYTKTLISTKWQKFQTNGKLSLAVGVLNFNKSEFSVIFIKC